ncbi:TIGR01777 family oxidoreductase [Aestuariirhabdus sp. Z084]|uniref:TIGR01777 family oxidoreductase n=1 Tax=Aestuariirhabdus haliotis TaxID=2918751 RepID=UPI00201B3C79|nr:TIGR01777 family oxidoreductase [Aestuariirhabdus haliotis]MCL6416889.1 TIGR01777 family oxidoreductase [Aestuariirhabdus haliotis]MCL6420892.1 TIGR01777 family oxidoreductase [Aestuariirhabdus haliotis]
MTMKIVVTGGTGCIGHQLLPTLVSAGYRVWALTRQSPQTLDNLGGHITYVNDLSSVPDMDAVINLAGEGVLDARWSESRKQILMDSRIGTTRLLLDWMKKRQQPPQTLISGSAVGYYGYHGSDRRIDESVSPQDDFASRLCQQWEASAQEAEALGIRVCTMRIGVVLAANAGALARMLPPFKLGLGGPIATGEQMFSWIQREDLVAMILFLLHSPELSGPFNATSPMPVTNQQFSKALARALRRPCWLTVPAYAMRLMLGEAADLLIKGQAVIPERLEKAGFSFRFADIDSAIEHSLA